MRIRNKMAFMLVSLTLLATRSSTGKEPIDIGARRELFVDQLLVDRMDGVRFQLHHPRPAEIAVTLDQPWEKGFYNGISVIKDGQRFLLYYSAFNRLAVAVSKDGVHWSKPKLGLIEIDGHRANNLVGAVDGKLMIEDTKPLPEVFLDRRSDTKPNERFKAFTLIEGRGPTKVICWISSDGFAFRKLRDEPIIETGFWGAFDGFESLFWSESEQQYVLYLRYARHVNPPDTKDARRAVARMTSPDLLTWSKVQPMTFASAGKLPQDHHYNNQTTPYFRAPHIYIALSNRLAQKRQALSRQRASGLKPSRTEVEDPIQWLIGDCADTVMLTTRGGTHYDRLFQEALVRPGPGAENWVTRSNFALRGLHPTDRHEMSIWVTRHNGQKSCHVRRFVFRTDGLVSVHAPFSGGELVTHPLIFRGGSLEINYATSAVGSIRVEVQDPDGKPIPGFSLKNCGEIFGDEIARHVAWNANHNLSKIAGKPVRLRFVMKDADLYSFRFTTETHK